MKKCYKHKITHWQNKLNNAINCAPYQYSEKNIKRALKSLEYFVHEQLETDSFTPISVVFHDNPDVFFNNK